MLTTEQALTSRSQSDILIDIMSFLCWADVDSQLYGGIRAEQALEAFRELLGWDEERFTALKNIITDGHYSEE